MNRILKNIKSLIHENLNKYLPDVKSSDLEDNGDIFYMNGRNGTEFDWYVNDHISDFMVFYNDEKNLGALKLTLYCDGNILIYVYEDKGNKLVKEVETSIKVSDKEMLDFAILLKNEADDKKLFNDSIEKISSDIKISKDKINEFKNNEKYFENMKSRKEMFHLKAIVSTKIIKEGYKVGYMVRVEPQNNEDSGWQFFAGNEEEDFINDLENVELVPLIYVSNLDTDILKYVENPIGTELIRISSCEFEMDNHTKDIYVEKRDCNN